MTTSDNVMDVMLKKTATGRRVTFCVLASEARAERIRRAIERAGGPEIELVEVASTGEGFDALADAMMPKPIPSSAFVEQVRRNVSERAEFLKTYGALDAEEVADAAGSRASNRRSLAARWRSEFRIFAVRVPPNSLVYPAFQFDPEDGQPRSIIAEVLAELPAPLRDGGWQLALWWDTPSEILDWRRPVDFLEKDPDALVQAAKAEAQEWAQADPSLSR